MDTKELTWKVKELNKVLENQKQIDAITTKLNRWQKVIDNRLGHDKDVMQDARDEVMQECIDAIRAILDK